MSIWQSAEYFANKEKRVQYVLQKRTDPKQFSLATYLDDDIATDWRVCSTVIPDNWK